MATNPQAQGVTGLLRDVSRSFYLTVRVLPGAVRPQIGLAYLLARAADTIADTDAVEARERLRALDQLRARILDSKEKTPEFDRFVPNSRFGGIRESSEPARERDRRPEDNVYRSPSKPETLLLERIGEALAWLDRMSESDRGLIRNVLSTITSGQDLDLRRFAEATPTRIVALREEAELDDYTYRVAGCVGEFWTKLCRARLFPNEAIDERRFLDEGIRFGKGLQLVNILRDLPRDLRLGRCYLPSDALAARGIEPAELLDGRNETRMRPLYDDYLRQAREHLEAGWNYTLTIPYRCVRLRLACAWPVLIGIRTLGKLQTGRCLDPHSRIKVSRKEIRGILFRSVIACPILRIWRRLPD